MTNEISKLFDEMKSRMGGYTFLMKYRFIHFSVKSDPAVMLAAKVLVDDQELNIEEVAEVAQPNDMQLAVIPKDASYIVPICEAIKEMHPEYKIETEELELDSNQDDTPSTLEEMPPKAPKSEVESKEVKPIVIFCTMPEMNEERKDLGMDFVKLNYDTTIAKLDAVKLLSAERLGKLLIKVADPSQLDAYKNDIDAMYEQHKTICETVRQEKEAEIDEAYQNFVSKEKVKQEMHMQDMAAKGDDVSKGMKIDPFLQD